MVPANGTPVRAAAAGVADSVSLTIRDVEPELFMECSNAAMLSRLSR
jgi:hypothetical protein